MSQQNEFIFLPLGGSNEIGMNLNLFGFGPIENRQWIIVDVGVTFGDVTTPGIEIICADPEFLKGETILAVVLTHAHEDHIGAIGWLWKYIKAPIYATAFTAYLIRDKLREHKVLDEAHITEVTPGEKVTIGPFGVEYVQITHSIPEANGLIIETDLGRVFHTGDWKLDSSPIVCPPTNEAKLKSLGDQPILAMVCDSTNVFQDGEAGSEADVKEALHRLIVTKKNRVSVACFASNVARLDSVMRVAGLCGRQVCLVGRSMHRITAAARHVGLLGDLPDPISENEASKLAPSEILYICTGSQGEPRAALSRIADGNHPSVRLKSGDCCIFSSRIIPGNEIAIRSLQNRLSDLGVDIITEKDHPGIHVSGHPCRDELIKMYQWIRPEIAIPTHGERRHIIKHALLAKELGIAQTITPSNGDMIRLAPGRVTTIDEVPSGRLFVDGGHLVSENSDALRERRHASHNGMVFVSFALDAKGNLKSLVDVRGLGLAFVNEDDISDHLERMGQNIERLVTKLSFDEREDDELIESQIARLVKKSAMAIWDRRPLVETIILRL